MKVDIVRTFGVCDFTFPARARDPWTLPMMTVEVIKWFDGYTESGDGRRKRAASKQN